MPNLEQKPFASYDDNIPAKPGHSLLEWFTISGTPLIQRRWVEPLVSRLPRMPMTNHFHPAQPILQLPLSLPIRIIDIFKAAIFKPAYRNFFIGFISEAEPIFFNLIAIKQLFESAKRP